MKVFDGKSVLSLNANVQVFQCKPFTNQDVIANGSSRSRIS